MNAFLLLDYEGIMMVLQVLVGNMGFSMLYRNVQIVRHFNNKNVYIFFVYLIKYVRRVSGRIAFVMYAHSLKSW